MLCSALALSVGTVMAAEIAARQVEYSFSIAAGPVESVLLEIARQSRHPISFDPSLVAGRLSGPIQGAMPLCEALDRTLKGMDLELHTTAEGIWTLRARAPRQTQPLSAYAPEIVVVGQRETAASEREVLLNSSVIATPDATPLSQIPYSVSTIDNTTLDRQQPIAIGDALQNASGVSVVVDTTHAYTTDIRLRGLEVHAQTADGMLDVTGYPAPLEGIQRIDVIKGPADSTLGNLSAGGLINVATKRPEMNEASRLSLRKMENGPSKFALDHSGVLGSDNRWGFRLSAATEHAFGKGGSETPPSEDYFAASLRYRSAATDWTMGLQYYRQRPLIRPFTSIDTGRPDRDSTLISPSLLGEKRLNDSTRAYLLLERQLSPSWVWRSRANWADYEARYRYFRPDFLVGEDQVLYGWTQETQAKRRSTSVANEFVWSSNTDTVRQKVLIGFGGVSARTEYRQGEDVVLGTLDLASRRFDAEPFDAYADTSLHRLDASSLYLQNQLSIGGRLKLLASVRRTRTKLKSNVPWTLFWDEHESVTRTERTSTGLGANYQLTPGMAVYASTMKGTNSLPEKISAGGQGLVPEQIRQDELGLKFDLLDDRLQARTSVFRLKSDYTNLPQPWMPSYYVTYPGQRLRGFEAEVSGRLLPGWDVIANFTKLDSRLIDGAYSVYSIAMDDINAIPGQARRFWRVWTSYAFQDEPLKHFGGTFGMTSVSSSYADVHGEVLVPGYLRLDASVFYRQADYSIELGVRNLTNERIYDPTISPLRISTQPSRQAMLTMTYRMK